MSVRYVVFGAAGRAFNGCREGQFDECGVVVGGHHFAKSSVDGRRCDSDGIVGDLEVRQDAPSVLKDEMSTRLYHSTDWTPESALWSPSSPSENSASD